MRIPGAELTEGYRIEVGTDASDPQWDDFIRGLEYGHHEQSTHWARVKQYQGWQPIRLKVFLNSDLIAGAQMLCRRLPVKGWVGYISSGPCYNIVGEQALEVLVLAINRVAYSRRIYYVAMTPYIPDNHLSEVLKLNGYKFTREILPPTGPVKATLILDLKKDFNQLLMDMRRETRREIKLATGAGFVVREGGQEDLHTLFNLMEITAVRRGEKPTPNSVKIFENIWESYSPGKLVKLFLVEMDNHPVSGGMIFTFGKTVRFWKYGWSGEYHKKYPNQLLYWELIKWAKNNGFEFFDIVHVDAAILDHLKSGLPASEELKATRYYGPTLFKTGFGGKVVRFSGPWYRFQNSFISRFYDYFGPLLLRIPAVKRMFSRI
jgi:peptidoglycan pentaglycine glycine transferase (the first glycine)